MFVVCDVFFFFFSSRRRHTRSKRDWSPDVCSSDLGGCRPARGAPPRAARAGRHPPRARRDRAARPAVARRVPEGRSEERRVGKECRTRGGGEESEKERRRGGGWRGCTTSTSA